MGVAIATGLLDRVLADAAASPAAEICGLLLGGDEWVGEVRPCRNVATDPATCFEIDPAMLIAAHRAERMLPGAPKVVGCYHSHPSGPAFPSARDAAGAVADGSLWLIVGWCGGAGIEARLWRAVPDGRVHGRFEAVAVA